MRVGASDVEVWELHQEDLWRLRSARVWKALGSTLLSWAHVEGSVPAKVALLQVVTEDVRAGGTEDPGDGSHRLRLSHECTFARYL